jgi:hypothetical protein
MAAALIVFAVLCQARNAAAGGYGCHMDGPGWIHPQLITETHSFTASIAFVNDIFLYNGGVGAVPCLFDFAWAGSWLVVDSVLVGTIPVNSPPFALLSYPSGILPVPTYGVTSAGYSLRIRANGPNPRCVARYGGDLVGITVLLLAGSGYSTPDSGTGGAGVLHFWRNIATFVQPARPKQSLPDGTLRCFPDTTGNRVKVTTKSYDMSGRD